MKDISLLPITPPPELELEAVASLLTWVPGSSMAASSWTWSSNVNILALLFPSNFSCTRWPIPIDLFPNYFFNGAGRKIVALSLSWAWFKEPWLLERFALLETEYRWNRQRVWVFHLHWYPDTWSSLMEMPGPGQELSSLHSSQMRQSGTWSRRDWHMEDAYICLLSRANLNNLKKRAVASTKCQTICSLESILVTEKWWGHSMSWSIGSESWGFTLIRALLGHSAMSDIN